MSIRVFLFGISLAVLGQTLARTVSWWGTTENPWITRTWPGTTTTPTTAWPTTARTTTAKPTTARTTTTTLSTMPWIYMTTIEPTSLCIDGRNGIVMHPTNCDRIVLCKRGTESEYECPYGENFSWKTLSCSTENRCSEYFEGHGYNFSLESEACFRQTQTYAEHPYEFAQYVDCANLTTLSCPSDHIFRWDYQRCLPGSQTTNQLQPVSAECGFWGKKAHPYLCEQYFQCQGWVPSLTSCPHGSIFHAPSNGCRSGNFQTCRYVY